METEAALCGVLLLGLWMGPALPPTMGVRLRPFVVSRCAVIEFHAWNSHHLSRTRFAGTSARRWFRDMGIALKAFVGIKGEGLRLSESSTGRHIQGSGWRVSQFNVRLELSGLLRSFGKRKGLHERSVGSLPRLNRSGKIA